MEARKRMEVLSQILADVTKEILDGKPVHSILEPISYERWKQFTEWGEAKYKCLPDSELREITAFFSTGEGVLRWANDVLVEFNSMTTSPNVNLYPFALQYENCENWTLTFDVFTFHFKMGNLKISEKKSDNITVANMIYCHKNLYSYSEWVKIAARAMQEISYLERTLLDQDQVR